MDLVSVFKTRKIRLTDDRLAVFNFIKKVKKPVDSATIVAYLKKHEEINRVTVFRILNLLTEKEILRKIDFSDGKARYEILEDDHHHFVCQKCGEIERIQNCTVGKIEKDLKKRGFLIKRHSLEFFGLCPNCIN